MYTIFIIGHIHYLINKSKMLIFTYNSDRRMHAATHTSNKENTYFCKSHNNAWLHL